MKLINIDSIKSLQLFNIIRYLSLVFIGIILVKSGFNTAQIGNYETLIIIGSSISFFWISGIIQTMLSSFKKSDTEKSPIIFSAFILLQLFSIIGFIIINQFNKHISNIFCKDDTINYISLFSYYFLIIGPTAIIEHTYLLYNKNKQLIIYGISSYVFQILIISAPALLFNSLEYCIYGLIASATIRYIWLIRVLYQHAIIRVSIYFIKEHIFLAIPLILSALLSGSGEYIDSIIISKHFDASMFALYRYGAKEFPIVLILATAFSNAMVPQIATADSLDSVLARIKKESKKMMHFLFPMSIIFLIISKQLYPLVYNSQYLLSVPVFNIYLLLIISRLLFPQAIIIGLRQSRIILYAAAIEICLNITLSLIFIHIWGIMGVAAATVIAYFIDKLILMIYNYKKNGIKPTEYTPIKTWFIYILVMSAVYIYTLL